MTNHPVECYCGSCSMLHLAPSGWQVETSSLCSALNLGFLVGKEGWTVIASCVVFVDRKVCTTQSVRSHYCTEYTTHCTQDLVINRKSALYKDFLTEKYHLSSNEKNPSHLQ